MFFFKSHAKNELTRMVPDLVLLFKNALYKGKASSQHPDLNTFS